MFFVGVFHWMILQLFVSWRPLVVKKGEHAASSDSDISLPPQASVSPSGYSLSKCFLPEESTVIGVYCSAGACLLLLLLVHCLWMRGLLQLSLCLLGKHKSLWTTLPRVHLAWCRSSQPLSACWNRVKDRSLCICLKRVNQCWHWWWWCEF